jgi:tRNA-guanine family transglycosylase
MRRVIEWTVGELPADRPRHLLGIGTVEDILTAVNLGVDTFDCAAPTRLARNGVLLTFAEEGFRMAIKNSRFRDDDRPVEDGCDCPACAQHSRAFLGHLFRTGELSYYRLATLHNVRFMVRLMDRVRIALAAGRSPSVSALRAP